MNVSCAIITPAFGSMRNTLVFPVEEELALSPPGTIPSSKAFVLDISQCVCLIFETRIEFLALTQN